MKIIQIILAFLLLAGTACAADDAALLGTWHHEQQMPNAGLVAAEMTFVKDGTFHGYIDVQGHRFWNYAGNWKVKDGWLYYDYTKSDRDGIPPGTKDKDQILQITPTELKIRSEGGEEIYERRKEE